ncbi:MAG: malonate decarboxylase holo-[acyl-carrier-protein] synthase [Rhodoferax sp.]|nr:malonate decarboxylase holo-[acyl-carrier-protein] synthase [Rhodoferax sp.]
MSVLQRHQLVWLGAEGWQSVLARAWDAQAHSLLAHWQANQLPLVVCRQRGPETAHTISLGLPAPLQWQRRKLALDVALQDIASVGSFPLLEQIALAPADAAQVQLLLAQTQALHVPLRVYGSYGWQQLTGLPCVRASSDLDLLIPVPNLESAGSMARALQGLRLACRVDGELVFPGGWAIAWREFLQLMDGTVDRVLVKERGGVQLMGMAELQVRLAATRSAGMSHTQRQAPSASDTPTYAERAIPAASLA